MKHKLTPAFIKDPPMPPEGRDRIVYWEGGFGLQVTKAGHKSFVVQYRTGRQSKRMSLKAGLDLRNARKEAKAILGTVAKGGDPLADKRKAAAAGGSTLKAVAEDYSTPDYYIVADVTPYSTSGSITIRYSSANLSDVSAPATVVDFSTAPEDNSGNVTVLGQVAVPPLAPWETITQTVSYPMPVGLPVGATSMQLAAQINPSGATGIWLFQNLSLRVWPL